MDVKAYIASGILELYVAGKLSEKENLEVARYMDEYPEIAAEVVAIEKAILELSASMAPKQVPDFKAIRKRLDAGQVTRVLTLKRDRGTGSWTPYLGWAASVALAIGLGYLYRQNVALDAQLSNLESQRDRLELQIGEARNSLENSKRLLSALRDRNVTVVPLAGQDYLPEAYAKAYWNKEEGSLFIDAQGLPEPPEGMAYQVWSLTMDPLTPTSVGLLDDFAGDGNKVFVLANTNDSQAFGITLEPAGGSVSPTLEKLCVLGSVTS